jgi:hypothetical protein
MAIIRATWFFKDDAGYGWSESLHLQAAVATLAAALPLAITLADFRRRMLGTGVSLYYIRVSDDLVKGDSQVYQVPSGNTDNSVGHVGAHDIANASVLLRLVNNDGLTRAPYYVRGQEDDNIIDGKFVGTAAFVNAAGNWRAQIVTNLLVSNFWGIKKRDALIIPSQIIFVAQNTATGAVTVSTLLPNGFGVNQPITIKGMQGPGQINGAHSVQSIISATQFTIAFNRLMGAPTRFGLVQQIGFTVVPINDVFIRRAGHRNAGRPFDSPRGRRSKRVRT